HPAEPRQVEHLARGVVLALDGEQAQHLAFGEAPIVLDDELQQHGRSVARFPAAAPAPPPYPPIPSICATLAPRRRFARSKWAFASFRRRTSVERRFCTPAISWVRPRRWMASVSSRGGGRVAR